MTQFQQLPRDKCYSRKVIAIQTRRINRYWQITSYLFIHFILLPQSSLDEAFLKSNSSIYLYTVRHIYITCKITNFTSIHVRRKKYSMPKYLTLDTRRVNEMDKKQREGKRRLISAKSISRYYRIFIVKISNNFNVDLR